MAGGQTSEGELRCTDPDSVCKTLGKLFKLSEPQSPKLKMRITFVLMVVCSTNI